ncbi:peptidoglycan DD-metalloendopeptidase family protein [Niallia nealsonii]|nr:peptidoglycan DD-metalloendopeptidase family protein [Niallia nealsonii]
MFIFPTSITTISNPFQNKGPNKHFGTDFAAKGVHEIVATASGTVSKSYYSNSYGECIMIIHTINGRVYETVYAHLQKGSRKVLAGQKVKQGQLIGIMGSTGNSTGQHLHYELHLGRWNDAKSNAVDPMNYLTAASQSIQYLNYVVKKGDTLTKISKQYQTTINAIMQANNLSDKNYIYAGQSLKIPFK